MKYQDLTIFECMEKVNDSLFLPDIQRPYVWKEDDIYLLFDSICRDYPFNTVLFWTLEKKTLQENKGLKRINFLTERWEENKVNTGMLERDSYYLAIDGQQRITSFYLALKGTYKIELKKAKVNADLYFNFLSGITENEKEMLYEFEFFPQSNDDIFIEEKKIKKSDSKITKYWIRLKFIISIDQLHEVQSKIKKRIKDQIDFEISDDQNGTIFKLWSKIRFDKLITYYDEKIQDYDKVLDIFVRTNSGGQRLNYSDLLFSYIKLNWNEARDCFSSLVSELNDGGKFKFDHDFILKTILFIFSSDQDGLKYRTSNFSETVINSVKRNWSTKLINSFRLMKDLISSRLLLSNDKVITSYNALIPIIYFIYKFDKKGIGEENDKISHVMEVSTRNWLITAMLTGVFGGQSDGILHKAKLAIDESNSGDDFPKDLIFSKFAEAKPALVLSITPELIGNSTYNSIESSLVLSLLYKNSINFAPLVSNNLPQQDHVISKSELKKRNISIDKINSIYNLRLVSASDNRIKSDESFSEWTNRLGKQVLANHFIPEGSWSADTFEEFLEQRKILFLDEIIK